MSEKLERQPSAKAWLCCVRPAVADAPAVPDSNGLDKGVHTQHPALSSTHVTATSHDVGVNNSTQPDIAPAGSDQASRSASAANSKQSSPSVVASPTVAAAGAGAAAAAAVGAVAATGSKQEAAAVVVRHAHPDLKPLMASSFNRTYTHADWDAAMAALEQVKQQNNALALQQLKHGQKGGSAALQRTSFASAASDQWHDAVSHTMSDASVSEAEQREVEQYLQELEMLRGPAPGPELSCTPTCVPDPPLLFAPKHWKYCQVDARPFCGYWDRDAVRSTPFPLLIDQQLGIHKLAMRCHESIPGMWLRVEGDQLILTATPNIIAIPGVMNYHEYFKTDSTLTSWALRRDISLGRSQGQMFMTTDGILIFRVFSSGVFSKTVDWICEDYMRVEDNGNVMICRQYSKYMPDNSTCSQYLIGRKLGPTPPPKGHKHH